MRFWSATVLFLLITAPGLLAQQDTQGKVQGQNPNGPTQAVSAATELPPTDEPGFVDKAKNWAQDHQLMERLNGDIDGWYPRLGGMTRGGGFAFGPGYRLHWNDVLLDLSFGISTKTYKAVDVKVRCLQGVEKGFEFWKD